MSESPLSRVMRQVEALAAVGTALSAAELLHSRRVFAPGKVLAWPTAKTRHRWMSGRLAPTLDRLFDERGVHVLLSARLVASGILMSPVRSSTVRLVCTGFLSASGYALALRSPYGSDGSETMLSVVMTASALGRAVGDDDVTRRYALRFIAAQSAFSYLVAGAAKVASPLWFDGTAVRDVLRTRIFGHRTLFERVRHRPLVTLALSRGVTAAEVLFPLVFLLPGGLRVLALAGMGGFHVANAGAMGLNRFVWAFLSTYPAIAASTPARAIQASR
ncbi:hypothetical protein [Leifsonia sp. ALI-44-B]|uniref:hypothetical protein n=1 Tax=Leifsonia sp. ALI-44-B TaxID=1933776 RepID=UPI001179BA30|nr:hypothetical protein [Leifsonia sp. ALI-44-B]